MVRRQIWVDDLEYEPDLIDEPDMFDDDYMALEGRELRMQPKRVRGTPKTRTMFPRKGEWSNSQELGQTQAFGPDENNRQVILKMEPWGMPKTWCISLGMQFTPTDDMNFQVVAEILTGAGGTVQQLEVDWQNGTRFAICGNTIQIAARYDVALPDDAVGPNLIVPPDLRLSATVGEYAGTAFPQPTRTVALYLEGTEDTTKVPIFPGSRSQYVRIPPYATTVSLIPSDTFANNLLFGPLFTTETVVPPGTDITRRSPGDINLIQVKRQAVASPVAFYNTTAEHFVNGWPITNGARFIYIENEGFDVGDDFQGFVKFGLQL